MLGGGFKPPYAFKSTFLDDLVSRSSYKTQGPIDSMMRRQTCITMVHGAMYDVINYNDHVQHDELNKNCEYA